MGRLIGRLALLSVAAAGLAGCDFGLSASAPFLQPRQVMLASASASSGAYGLVSTYAIPHGFSDVGIEESLVQGEGGILLTERACPATAPAIAASDLLYVVAYWGGLPGSSCNFLHVFTSEHGGRYDTWSRAGSLFIASSSQIDGNSRPALLFFPPTGTWFVAFRDASSGTIVVDQLDIVNTGQFDQRSERIFNASQITSVDTGLVTARAPALSYIGTRLVLAFTSPSIVSIATTTNDPGSASRLHPYEPTFGRAVLAATTVTAVQASNSGTAVVSEAGAPYLHHILENIYLATARSPQGSVDIHVLQSGDGMAWNTEVVTVRGVAAWTAPVDPAIAGPASEMVVAYRNASNLSTLGTTVTVNGGSFSLNTETAQSVGATYGPGPTLAERLSCADPSLVARTSSGDTPILAGGGVPTIVRTNGDLTLLCGTNATIAPGCPAGTTLVTIRRGVGSSNFALQCWPR